jgi:pimeloyl-ACP methyl ester carboxylesterase
LTELLLSEGWNKATSFADQCVEGNEDVGSFLSTTFVARDMLSIVDALGEDGMLRFWGTSYGTFLGQTFAAMFPDRIDRMFLDSVVDPHDYSTGFWATYPLDAERSLDNFFSECLAAPDLCALANVPGLNTTGAMHAAFASTLDDLLQSQIMVDVGQVTFNWEYARESGTLYEHLKRSTLLALYNPSNFIALDTDLTMALTGNYTYFTETLSAEVASFEPPLLAVLQQAVSSLLGVACLDASERAQQPEEIIPYVELQQQSSDLADVYLPQYWACPAWKFEPPERYEGNFSAANTSAPILFSNGINDPSTPMASARNASASFPGSALIVHGGLGHSIFAQPSRCTEELIRTYFLEGALPDHETECQPDMGAFELAYAGAGNATTEPAPDGDSGSDIPSSAGRAIALNMSVCAVVGMLAVSWLGLV